MASRLTLTVLIDNATIGDHDYCGEAGLSFLLETAGKKILFDTGLSGLFLANAEKMGIDLQDLDTLVFSHGHIDHTGGLPVLIRYLAGATPDGKAAPGAPAHRPPPLLLAKRKRQQEKRLPRE